jgi:flagellar basal-body rod modification protein FlgD
VPSTSQLPLQNSQAELAYTLPSAAASVTITVKDASGNVVNTLSGPTTAGLDRVAWNGMNSSDSQVADGTYTFSLVATDSSGNPITVTDTRAVGLVTSIASGTSGVTNLTLTPGMSVSSETVDAVYTSSNLPKGTLGDPQTPSTSTPTSTSSTSS